MSAIISACGSYRYLLKRPPRQSSPMKGPALFIMLNPSTADAEIDDPTIRRCRSFSERWDCNGIAVANLYALRGTDPKVLRTHAEPIGPDNDLWLRRCLFDYEDVVFAWGNNAQAERAAAVVKIFKSAGRKLWCLGQNKNGSPKHPLYVKASQPLVEFVVNAERVL